MNSFNRMVMLIFAVLIIGIPVVILLTAFRVIPAGALDSIFGYTSALDGLGRLSASAVSGVWLWTGIATGLIFLASLLLILRELSYGLEPTPRAIIDDRPGSETVIVPGALRHLAEGAAIEAGAIDPRVAIGGGRRAYEVRCDLEVARSDEIARVAERARANILRVLGTQRVPVKRVEVTVRGVSRQGGRAAR